MTSNDWADAVPANDELKHLVAIVASWRDTYGVDVPIQDGVPLLGDALTAWCDQHRHYSFENDFAKGIEVAALGFAYMLKFAELERGFTWGGADCHA